MSSGEGTVRYGLIVMLGLVGGLFAQSPDKFDVVSVKANTGIDFSIRSETQPPDGFREANIRPLDYIRYAFDIAQISRIAGLPEWAQTTRYDITGKARDPITEAQRRAMVRDVLTTRFRLNTHIEQRDQTIYVMTADRPDKRLGPGLKPRPDCADLKDASCSTGGGGGPTGVRIQAITLSRFAEGMMSNLLQQIVRDETGVPGLFDVDAKWRPQSSQVDPSDTRPDVFTAFREQLGLKMEPVRRMVDVLVIDHIERPTEN